MTAVADRRHRFCNAEAKRICSSVMLLRIALLLAVLGSSAHATDGVWKWVDAQGVTHYADRPVPGAVQVDIKIQSSPGPTSTVTTTSGTTAAQSRPAIAPPPYRLIEVWKPAVEETIVNTGGKVDIKLRLDPALRPRHTLAVYLDGKWVEGLVPGALEVEAQNVPRGTHGVVATVSDDTGKIVQQSPQVVFYVRQESVAQPPVGPTLRPRPKP